MFSAASRALNKILHDGQFTALEMAEVIGCSDRHIYSVRNGDADLKMADAEKLSRWLCQHKETRMSRAFVCAGYSLMPRATGTADGRVEGEIQKAVEALGRISEAHAKKDADAMTDSLGSLQAVLKDLTCERDAIKI